MPADVLDRLLSRLRGRRASRDPDDERERQLAEDERLRLEAERADHSAQGGMSHGWIDVSGGGGGG
jgi:hypothetical protein